MVLPETYQKRRTVTAPSLHISATDFIAVAMGVALVAGVIYFACAGGSKKGSEDGKSFCVACDPVLITKSGQKYHRSTTCRGLNNADWTSIITVDLNKAGVQAELKKVEIVSYDTRIALHEH